MGADKERDAKRRVGETRPHTVGAARSAAQTHCCHRRRRNTALCCFEIIFINKDAGDSQSNLRNEANEATRKHSAGFQLAIFAN